MGHPRPHFFLCRHDSPKHYIDGKGLTAKKLGDREYLLIAVFLLSCAACAWAELALLGLKPQTSQAKANPKPCTRHLELLEQRMVCMHTVGTSITETLLPRERQE